MSQHFFSALQFYISMVCRDIKIFVATKFPSYYSSLCRDIKFLCRGKVSQTSALFYVAT